MSGPRRSVPGTNNQEEPTECLGLQHHRQGRHRCLPRPGSPPTGSAPRQCEQEPASCGQCPGEVATHVWRSPPRRCAAGVRPGRLPRGGHRSGTSSSLRPVAPRDQDAGVPDESREVPGAVGADRSDAGDRLRSSMSSQSQDWWRRSRCLWPGRVAGTLIEQGCLRKNDEQQPYTATEDRQRPGRAALEGTRACRPGGSDLPRGRDQPLSGRSRLADRPVPRSGKGGPSQAAQLERNAPP